MSESPASPIASGCGVFFTHLSEDAHRLFERFSKSATSTPSWSMMTSVLSNQVEMATHSQSSDYVAIGGGV